MNLDLTSLSTAGDAGGFDFASLMGSGGGAAGGGFSLGNLSDSASAGGFNINRFTSAAVQSAGLGGVMSLASSGAALGTTLGSVFPGVGNALGAVIGGAGGAVVGLYNKFVGGNPRVRFSAEASAAAPHRPGSSPTLLYDQNFNEDNGNEYARWAIENGATVEDIGDAVGINMGETGNSWETVVVWYRSHPETLRGDLAKLYARHPEYRSGAVRGASASGFSQALAPSVYTLGGGNGFAAAGSAQPIAGNAAAASNPATLMDWIKLLASGAGAGATKGMGDVVAGTSTGQQIKKDQINDYVKTYQLPLAAAGVGLVLLVIKAFKK